MKIKYDELIKLLRKTYSIMNSNIDNVGILENQLDILSLLITVLEYGLNDKYIDDIKNNMINNSNNICPLIINTNGIVLDGNHRYFAAISAKIDRLPCVVIDADIEFIETDKLKPGWYPDGR